MNLKKLLIIFISWRVLFIIVVFVSGMIIPQHPGYIGPIPWANMDGIHYLSIAKNGYMQYEQAFFPLFPFAIYLFSLFFKTSLLISGIFLVNLFLILTLIYFWRLLRIDFDLKTSTSVLVFFLVFPTSFFLTGIYSESLFLFLMFASFYYMRKEKFLISAVFAAFSSATRLIGIIMFPILLFEIFIHLKDNKIKYRKEYFTSYIPAFIVPLGIISYMYYLWRNYGDPFLFIHSQPAFGAGRSGGEIILLPQVIWRYIKIFITIPISNYDFWIALLEIGIFSIVILVLFLAYKNGIRRSYILFSFLSLIIPTLSGTLSSIPRYALSVFVIFIFFATMKNSLLKHIVIYSGVILQIILTALFIRGYFVG